MIYCCRVGVRSELMKWYALRSSRLKASSVDRQHPGAALVASEERPGKEQSRRGRKVINAHIEQPAAWMARNATMAREGWR